MKRIVTIILCLMLVVSALAGCGDEKTESKATDAATQAATEAVTTNTSSGSTKPAADAATESIVVKGDMSMVKEGSITDLSQVPGQDLTKVDRNYQSKAPEQGDVVAILHTNYGDIKLRLFAEAAPMAVNNFVALSKADKYDNTIFHRIFHPQTAGISGIQGGDYTDFNGHGGESIYGTSFGYELSPYLSNIRGSLAMAHSSLPNSNGSQFYINQGDNSVLDGGYTVFGQVFEGLDVVDAIYAVETDSNDTPLTRVELTSVDITTY